MKRKSVYFIAQAAIIATLYATLTVLQNVLVPGSASAAVQFRVSEVLTILALYTPAAIPGLTVGCVLANISSVAVIGPIDMLFGSLASCIAAVLMYMLRRAMSSGSVMDVTEEIIDNLSSTKSNADFVSFMLKKMR